MAAESGKIMLVEDDASMRMLLKTLLEIEGHPVVSYYEQKNSAVSILDMVRAEHPAAILLDVHLRDASGIDVLRDIRADTSLDDVKVIMSSGMDVKEECMAAGASYFLLKPYMPDELLSRLPS
jgi:CheY-like chemotaxis protein